MLMRPITRINRRILAWTYFGELYGLYHLSNLLCSRLVDSQSQIVSLKRRLMGPWCPDNFDAHTTWTYTGEAPGRAGAGKW